MELRKLLKKTWGPIFGRHGRTRRVQEMAIPHVLAGENVIIVSPAATGKTEAAIAPVIERMLQKDAGALSLLYVSPTRALVNDLEVRLKYPVESLGLSISVQTGDRPLLSKTEPEDMLITTPESLDSLLCRHRKFFTNVQAVVIDELHLLDNTYRGDQLICLLKRMRHFCEQRQTQYIALSATLSDPAATAGRYFGSVTVVDTREKRQMRWYVVSDLKSAITLLMAEKFHKALLFCNSRKDVEQVSIELRDTWPKDRVLVHHGSLSKVEREETEKTFRLWEWGICIATTTLEIGVDIGDVDASVLFKPPLSPSSFLQRVGRSRRRENEMAAVCIVDDEKDRDTFERYIEMTSEARIEITDYTPDLSVAVQQIFSILFGHPGGVATEDLFQVLSPLSDETTLERILDHLIETGYVEPGILRKMRATTALMDMGERGTIHSNIPDSKEYRVVDVESGRTIGRLVLQAARGTTFLLSGKAWEIVEHGRDSLGVRLVQSISTRTHFARRFQLGAFTSFLPPELRPGSEQREMTDTA